MPFKFHFNMKKNMLLPLFYLFATGIYAQLELPAIFSDNLVLQQNSPYPNGIRGAGNNAWLFVDEIIVE